MSEKVSTCCSAPDKSVSYDGPSFEDIGICPDCKDHCDFAEACELCGEYECDCEANQTVTGPYMDRSHPFADAKTTAVFASLCISLFIMFVGLAIYGGMR